MLSGRALPLYLLVMLAAATAQAVDDLDHVVHARDVAPIDGIDRRPRAFRYVVDRHLRRRAISLTVDGRHDQIVRTFAQQRAIDLDVEVARCDQTSSVGADRQRELGTTVE